LKKKWVSLYFLCHGERSFILPLPQMSGKDFLLQGWDDKIRMVTEGTVPRIDA
jgi:hypothetical protein